MKKTSLIPICNAIFNADTTVLSDGEKLLRLHNVFDEDALNELSNAFRELEPGLVTRQEHRKRTSWDLGQNNHAAMSNEDRFAIQKAIETAMDTKFESMGVTLWEDKESYNIPKHVDNDGLNAAMQIYLPSDEGALPNTGTIIYDGIQEYQVPFVPNNGYFISNSNTTVHSSGEQVKAGHVRRSVYFYFRR